MGSRTISVTITGDASSLKRAMSGSEQSLKRLEGSSRKTQGSLSTMEKGMRTAMKATAIVAGGAAITGALKNVLGAAGAVYQSAGALDAVFGANAESMHAAAKAADTAGLAQSEYAQMAAQLGAQLGNLGTAEADLAPVTQDLIKHAGDLSATFGGTTADAVRALSSAFRSEFNPIEKFGAAILKSDVNAKMASDGLTQSAATIELIMDQTSMAIGQAERETDSFGSAQQRLAASTEDAKAALGEGLLPIFAKLSDAGASAGRAFQAIPTSLITLTTTVGLAVAAYKLLQAGLARAAAALAAKAAATAAEAAATSAATLANGAYVRSLGEVAVMSKAGGMGYMARNLKSIAGVAALAAGSLIAYSAGVGKARESMAGFARTSDELAASLAKGRDALSADTSYTKPWWQGNIFGTEQVLNFRDSLDLVNDSWLQTVVTGDLFGNKQALILADTANLITAYEQIAQTDPSTANGLLLELQDALHGAGNSAEEVGREFPGLAAAIESSGAAMDSAATKTQSLTAEFDAAKEAASLFSAAMAAVFAKDDSARALDAYRLSVLDLKKEMSQGKFNIEAGIKGASRAAIQNRDALRKTADAGRAYTNSLITQGSSLQDVMGAYRSQRSSLRETAESMGATKGQARRYANELLGTPEDIKTAFHAATGGANADVNALQGNINATPTSRTTNFYANFIKNDPLGVAHLIIGPRALQPPEPTPLGARVQAARQPTPTPRLAGIFGRPNLKNKRITISVAFQADIQEWTSATKGAEAQVRRIEKAVGALEKRREKAGKKQKRRLTAQIKKQKRLLRIANNEVKVAQRAEKVHRIRLAAAQAQIVAAENLARTLNKLDIGRAFTDAKSQQATALTAIDTATKNIAENFWNPAAVTYWKSELAKAQKDLANANTEGQVRAQVDSTRRFLASVKSLQGKVSDAVLGEIISTGNADLARELVDDASLRAYYNSTYTEMQKLTFGYTNTLKKSVYDATYSGVSEALKKAFAKYRVRIKRVTRLRTAPTAAPVTYAIKVDAAMSDPDAVARRIEEVLADRAARDGMARI